MLSKCCFSDDHDDDDVLTDSDCCLFDFEDINECDTGNNTCTTEQVCFNFQGGYTCLDPLQCHSPYVEVSDKWVFLLFFRSCFFVLWMHPHHLCPITFVFIITQPNLTQSYKSPFVSSSAVSVCVQLRTLPAGTSPSLFCTDTWTCRRGAVCLQTSSRCRPPRATPALSTFSR